MATIDPRPVAIFPWGDVVEEFLGPLNLSVADYAACMRGGWLFGYVAALARQGRSAIIIHASENVSRPERLTHEETGAAIWLVPGRRSGGRLTRGRPSLSAAVQWGRTPLAAFAKILLKERCGAVLIQDYEHPRFDALVLLAGLLGLPAYASFQGGDVTLSPLEAMVRPRSLRACKAVICPSARERARLARTYHLTSDRLVDIPNPVDADFWSPTEKAEARVALGLPKDGFVVANHGRIDIHRKGLDVLLAAWARVRRARPEARLVILGSGQDRAAFAAMVAGLPGVEWRSEYVTDPPLIRRWLSAADAYVTLSRTEGMPVAPLEAQACGLPMVASDAHGLPDILPEGEASGGILVPREDAQAAASALIRLAEDAALRQRLGRAARANVEARYGLEAVGSALARTLDGDGRPARLAPSAAATVQAVSASG